MRIALVQTAYADVGDLVQKVNKVIINPIIILLFSLALLYFVYGVFEFLANGDSEEARSKGRSHMLYGLLGMFIMMAVFTIMQILINSFGVEGVDVRSGEVDIR